MDFQNYGIFLPSDFLTFTIYATATGYPVLPKYLIFGTIYTWFTALNVYAPASRW